MNRYYSTLRPVAPGTFPKNENFVGFENFDNRQKLDNGIEAWGWVEYSEPLSEADMKAYDLVSGDAKEWVSVMSMIYDDGRCKMLIADTVVAVEKPENVFKSLRNRDVYVDWFEGREAAEQFIKENE